MNKVNGCCFLLMRWWNSECCCGNVFVWKWCSCLSSLLGMFYWIRGELVCWRFMFLRWVLLVRVWRYWCSVLILCNWCMCWVMVLCICLKLGSWFGLCVFMVMMCKLKWLCSSCGNILILLWLKSLCVNLGV